MATQAQIDSFTGMLAAGNVAGATSLAESLGYNSGQVDEYISSNPGSVGGGAGNLAEGLLSQYEQAMGSGDYVGASNLINQAAGIYGPETYANLADYLNTQEQFSGLRDVVGGSIYTPENVQYFAKTISDLGVDAIPTFYVDPQAYGMLTQFDDLIAAGDFENAALLVDEAAGIYGEEATLENIATYLNTNPRFEDLRKAVGDKKYTSGNIKEFINSVKNPTKPIVPPVPTGTSTAGLSSIPRLERQAPSMITFAPPRRGLAQLRPAAFMPGLLEGQPGFGGSGFTPEQLRNALNTMTAQGQTPADVAYLMDVGGVSPAELAAATGIPAGQIQGEYNFNRPQGLFSSVSPQAGPTFKDTSQLGAFNLAIAQGDFERGAQIAQAAGFSPSEAEYYINANLSGLNQAQPIAPGTIGSLYSPNAPTPPGLALQTGAFGATIPTTVAIPQPSSSTAPQPGSTFDEQMAYLSNMYLGRPLTAPEMATYRTDYGGELNQGNITDFLNRSQQEMANRLLVGTNPEGVNTPLTQQQAVQAVLDSGLGRMNVREGGVIKMTEGGMPRLSAKEAGSRFDISEFIDEEGRLVGGYSRPVYDENQVIIGYEYTPYERDVVLNPVLARREEEERERMRNMARGGLASVAQDLADKGRFGDTMVAHISPQEAGILKALGGSGTINPQTGLPEFFSLFPKKGIKLNLGPLGNVKIGSKSSNIIQAAAALAAGDVMGLTAGQAALAYGGVRAAATGNLMEGIQAGLTAYGMGNMYEGLSGTTIGTPSGTAPIDTVQVGSGAGGLSPEASGQVLSQNVPVTEAVGSEFAFDPATGEQLVTGMEGVAPAGTGSMRTVAQPVYGTSGIPGLDKTVGATSASEGFLGRNLPPAVQEYTPKFLLEASGPTLATGTVLGGSLLAGQQERSAAAAQQAALNREREERKRRYQDLFAQTLGRIPIRAAGGGLMSLAGGGMTYMEAGGTTGPTGTPRDVAGTGDGMSDSVPATIEGVQEARLADGEFVIPADVVADIGNGSSDAGSKKLYDMMDRIRQARHGTKEQPPEIKAERLMPA